MPYRLLCGAALYLLAFTYSCVNNYFDTDDMMNLYGAWHRFPDQVRPAGALFYRILFDLFGFNPLPFHIAGFLLIFLNLALLLRLLQKVGRDPSTVAAGLLFGCFQGTMWMIYASTGMIYDVLCATFLYSALLVDLERPKWWPLVALLHVGAMSSKELGVALPGLLLLLRPAPSRALLATSVLSAIFLAQRFLIPGPLTGMEAYTPVFTPERLLTNITVYTKILTSHAIPFTPLTAVAFWAILFFLARHNKPMRTELLFFWIALSPMLSATPRHAGYVLYVPIFGLALAVGAKFTAIYQKVNRRVAVAVFVALVLALHIYQKKITMKRGELPAGHPEIRQLALIRLPLMQGDRILIHNSPGLITPWLGAFTLTLTHKVRDLTVHEPPATPLESDYKHIIRFPPKTE